VSSRSWFNNDETLKIDGVVYTHGLYSGVIGGCVSDYRRSVQVVEYSIDRRYTNFAAVVGASDRSTAGVPIKVDITGDGQPLWSETVQVGQPKQLSLPVSGILRLAITATQQADDSAGCVYAALGDPVLE
jgi:NPCBM/NEW2 domain